MSRPLKIGWKHALNLFLGGGGGRTPPQCVPPLFKGKNETKKYVGGVLLSNIFEGYLKHI